MSRKSKILELASRIQANSILFNDHLEACGHDQPSFAIDAPPDITLPPSLREAQNQILGACTELQALVEGPRAQLTRILSPKINILISLQAIHRYQITSHIGLDEKITYEELSQRCGLDKHQLRRLLRLAICNNIFQELEKDVISHSAISRFISEDKLAPQWISLVCNEFWHLGPKTLPTINSWPAASDPGKSTFALANGGSFWDVINSDPMRAQLFADGMNFVNHHPAFDLEYLFNDLGWDHTNCPQILVDIGGSQGSIAEALLRRYPKLSRCYVQDAGEVLVDLKAPDDLQDRLHFSAHDFFTEQDIKDADVYFMRSILHDWPDDFAARIIRNIIPSLKGGARVIVNDISLPDPGSVSNYHAQFVYGYDLSMLQLFNSRERDAKEWEALFHSVDKNFRLVRNVCSPGSILSVIEFEWLHECTKRKREE